MDSPFACFGDSSCSSSSDGSDSGSDDGNRNPCLDDATAKQKVASNLAESRRLCNKSNADRPLPLTPIVDTSRFSIFDSGPSSGFGLRATVAYKRGDEIFREYAAMRVPNTQTAASLEEAGDMHRAAVERAYNLMHDDTRCAFMELSSSCDDNDDDEGGGGIGNKTPRGVYDTNAFRLGGGDNDPLEKKGGVFLTISRMNHSCRPNVNHYWRPNLQMTLVFATRDIRAGEELCTIYGPSEWMDTRGRREYLSDRFSFVCECEMCREGNVNGGDERMEMIRLLQESIALSSSSLSGNSVAALQDVDRCLSLMTAQGIGGGAFTKAIYHRGYAICTASGDDDMARSYLQSELTAVRDSEGVDSSNALEIECMLNQFGVVV